MKQVLAPLAIRWAPLPSPLSEQQQAAALDSPSLPSGQLQAASMGAPSLPSGSQNPTKLVPLIQLQSRFDFISTRHLKFQWSVLADGQAVSLPALAMTNPAPTPVPLSHQPSAQPPVFVDACVVVAAQESAHHPAPHYPPPASATHSQQGHKGANLLSPAPPLPTAVPLTPTGPTQRFAQCLSYRGGVHQRVEAAPQGGWADLEVAPLAPRRTAVVKLPKLAEALKAAGVEQVCCWSLGTSFEICRRITAVMEMPDLVGALEATIAQLCYYAIKLELCFMAYFI